MKADLAEVQRRLVERIETERLQLARLLHDGPVQDLYAIDYQLHGLIPDELDAKNLESLNVVQGMLHRVIRTLLNTVGELRPVTLNPFGLNAAILSHIHRFKETFPQARIDLDLDEDRQNLPEPLRLGLFRIYQQLIHNIEQHAKATCVSIVLKIREYEVVLSVADNGVGFEVPDRLVTYARAGQLGLASALEQAQRLDGQMQIDSHPGSGTRVTITCALKTPCQAACPQAPGNGLNEGK
jgi:signal transduction histidine kinase